MNYIKLSQRQINTLKKLPSDLNDSVSNRTISGLMILNKSNEIKQIILDFQVSSLQEFYTSSNSKVNLYKHIKDDDPKNNRVLTFEIVNNLKLDKGDAYSIPSINQWLKCAIHSLYRNIPNHIVLTPSDDVYVISIKKTYYYQLFNKKNEMKWKLKDIFHYLTKNYINILNEHLEQNGSSLDIPKDFFTMYNIEKFNNSDIFFYYNTLIKK